MTACTKVNIITACKLNRVNQIQNHVSKQLKIEEKLSINSGTEQGKNNKRQVVYVLQKLIRKSVNAILYLPTLFWKNP